MVYVCSLEGLLTLDGTEVDAHRWFSPTELLVADISFPSLEKALLLYVSQCDLDLSNG